MTDVLQRRKIAKQRLIDLQEQTGAAIMPPEQYQDTSDQQYRQALEEFNNKYIRLDDGQYVEREKYNALDSEAQNIIMSKGVDEYNKYKAQQAEAEFAQSNVKLADGNWVTKETFDALPPEWQGYLYDKGVDGYQKWWESKPYGNSTEYFVMDGRVYVPSENPNIGIDATGMRVWLGDRWPEHAIKYSGRATDVNTAQLLAEGKTLVPAEVTLPSMLPAKKEEQKQPESIKIISPSIAMAEPIMKQTELSSTGKETIKQLESNYKIDTDQYNLTKYLQDNPGNISKLVDAGFSNDDIINAVNLNSVNKEIESIKAKQKEFESKPLIEKIGSILNMKISGGDLLKETLSLGGAKTKAFDTQQIELEYLEAQKDAMESGSTLQKSKQEYVNEVLGKQATAAELGMQFVPFEYARPERWNELQTWEKIVYPALDVVTLIPVVGLAGKAASAGIKAVSTGAKLAALGGRQAVEFAAKDSLEQLAKAATKKTAMESLYKETAARAAKATGNEAKILNNAVKAAEKDLQIINKEYGSIYKNAEMLNTMATKAGQVTGETGAKAFKAASTVERVGIRTAKATEVPANFVQSGAVSKVTVENWNDLNPAQKAGGVAMAMLPLGIGGKVLNVVENVVDPYKIPIAALKARALPTKVQAGKLFSQKGGTSRLVIDSRIGTVEEARNAVSSLNRQIVEEGKGTAKAQYGTKEIKYKATGLQQVTGKTFTSATPMGEIFKEGTGAFGKKTNLEKYLEDANKNLPENEKIVIKSGDISTESLPGVKVSGTEGGQYFAADFAYKFSEQAAFGAKGKIRGGILLGIDEISKLPPNVAKKKVADMEKAAIKTFNGSKYTNEMVEGFKQYAKFMEFENVLTNGSRELRVKNLRSNLVDKLKLNRGEYYTRDPKGRIELFQMYMESGGRTTPYTLKELYALKGKALKNSLEDIFVGIGNKLDEFRSGKPKDIPITKESQLNDAFAKIDRAAKNDLLTPAEVIRAKKEIYDQFRENSRPRLSRPEIQKRIETEYARIARDGRYEPVPLDRIASDRTYNTAPRQDIDRIVQRDLPRERIISTGRVLPRELPREPVREIPREIPRELPRGELREMPREPVRNIPRELLRTTPREQPRETPREPLRELPRISTDRTPIKDIPKVHIIPKNGKSSIEGLSDIDRKGIVAWKQGFIYIAIYPPYEEPQTLYSREPFEGVKYESGIGSAARTIIAKIGKIPQHIQKDMGIMDITINKSSDKARPGIVFRLDRMQRTTYSKPKQVTAGIKAVR